MSDAKRRVPELIASSPVNPKPSESEGNTNPTEFLYKLPNLLSGTKPKIFTNLFAFNLDTIPPSLEVKTFLEEDIKRSIFSDLLVFRLTTAVINLSRFL